MARAKVQQDVYVKSNTYVFGRDTVTVHRPILTEEERNKRYDACRKALADFGRYLVDAGLEELL